MILLTCSLLCGLHAVEAQSAKKVFRVGYLRAGSAPFSAPLHVAFVQGLQELGYVQGQNLIIEDRKADGQADRLPDLAAELARLPVDVIVPAAAALLNGIANRLAR